MPELSTIYDYMRAHPRLLGEPILQELSRTSPNRRSSFTRIDGLLRKPFLAQAFAIMGLAQRWQQVRTGVVVANCGTGKTLISLGNPSPNDGNPFTAISMVPPHLVEKWTREAQPQSHQPVRDSGKME
jgi:hypothetical protein